MEPPDTAYPPPPPAPLALPLEPNPPENLPLAAATTPAVRLRFNLLSTIQRMPTARRRAFIFLRFVRLLQLITFICVLSTHSDSSCRLSLYLVLNTCLIGVGIPVSLYTNLIPPVIPRDATRQQRAELEARRPIGSARLDDRIQFLSTSLGLLTAILFVWGNIYFFDSASCRVSSPTVYWTTLAGLLVGWIYVAEIVLIVILVVFFLPVFVIILRLLGVTLPTKANEIGPLSPQQIEKLPVVVFIPAEIPLPPSAIDVSTSVSASAPVNHLSASSEPPATNVVGSSEPTAKSYRLFRLIRNRSRANTPSKVTQNEGVPTKDDSPYPALPSGLCYHPVDENRATCSICLLDYDAPPLKESAEATNWIPERLNLLQCGHVFHADCLRDWLTISGRCPICQAHAIEVENKESV